MLIVVRGTQSERVSSGLIRHARLDQGASHVVPVLITQVECAACLELDKKGLEFNYDV